MITDELLHKAYMLYPMIIPKSNNKESLKDVEDINKDKREAYILGYLQAEKDNELTWEDIPKIILICENLKTSWWFRDNEQTKLIGTQTFFEEVLKRFKERKER